MNTPDTRVTAEDVIAKGLLTMLMYKAYDANPIARQLMDAVEIGPERRDLEMPLVFAVKLLLDKNIIQAEALRDTITTAYGADAREAIFNMLRVLGEAMDESIQQP